MAGAGAMRLGLREAAPAMPRCSAPGRVALGAGLALRLGAGLALGEVEK